MFLKEHTEKRFLAVYDLSSQPYSIGDILFFLQASVLKLSESGTEKLDICFISDPTRPTVDHHFADLIKNRNGWHNLLFFLPLVQFVPSLGNVFIYGSFDEFERLIARENYTLWPSYDNITSKKYLCFDILALFHTHAQKNNPLQLRVPPALTKWAGEFFERHALPRVPITVNLRNNSLIQPHRNSNIEAWLEFFDYCNDRYPVTFIVVCAKSEIDDRLRSRKNVVLAKDQQTSMEQDLVLTRLSAFHLGTASGAGAWPVFTDKPYLISGATNIMPMIRDYGSTVVLLSPTHARFSFAKEHQNIILVKEDRDQLIQEFETIWNSASSETWMADIVRESSKPKEVDSLRWLR